MVFTINAINRSVICARFEVQRYLTCNVDEKVRRIRLCSILKERRVEQNENDIRGNIFNKKGLERVYMVHKI